MKKIHYILSHPIQYQSPLIRYLVYKGVNIKVFYRSSKSINNYFDTEFKKKIKWDIDLLRGYNHEFLKYIGPNKTGKFYPINVEIFKIFKNTDYIWIHGIKNWYSILILMLNFFFNKKILVREEIQNINNFRSQHNLVLNKIFYKLINKYIHKFLFIGKANKDFYQKMGISKKKLILIPYVVDNEFFNKYKKVKKKNTQTEILLASKFIKKKGIDIFINAIIICNKNKRFRKNVKIKIVGDGPEKINLIKQKKENKIKNIYFKKFQNQKKLKNYYQKSDIFILPSRYEPWGLTTNEAMASGNLIITSKNVGSANDLVKHGYNGFIFNNHKDLSKYLLEICFNKKKIQIFKSRSLKLINKWNFELCYKNLIKIIND
tara:strand:+ start:7178 stop:8302 length:1125 start_codon:yes stop_codon:yes gene_type:complete